MSRIICVGIGDILLYKLVYETYGLRDPLTINRDLVRQCRNDSDAYWNFLKDLIAKLFPDTEIKYIDTPTYQLYHIWPHYPFKPGTDICKYFNLDSIYDFEYVVIHTKIRLDAGVECTRTDSIKKAFAAALSGVSSGTLSGRKKIVIMGDKSIPDIPEKAAVNIQSMYPELLVLKERYPNLIIDRTVDDLCCSPSIDNFETDLRILANASMVIGIGGGGYCAMTVLFAKKYKFYVGDFGHSYIKFFKTQNSPTKMLYASLPDFLAALPEVFI